MAPTFILQAVAVAVFLAGYAIAPGCAATQAAATSGSSFSATSKARGGR
jgi:hypothetical protein